jgi:hypothetical protein
MIRPAERMMEVCEDYGVRLTFFYDVCEHWAFQEVQDGKGFENGERPADRLEEHLKEIVRRGHEVQLHFHPQWLRYEYLGKGEWQLDHSLWRLPDVEEGWPEGGEKPLEELFRRGKATLERILRSEDPSYECRLFRAGAWCIQPEGKVLEAMRAVGIEADSTVAPGKSVEEGNTRFNFKNAPKDRPYWRLKEDLCQADAEGDIWEYPIFTESTTRMQNAWFTFLKILKRVPLKAPDCRGASVSEASRNGLNGKWKKLKEVLTPGQRMFTYTDGTTLSEMQWMVRRAQARYRDHEGTVPIIAIGHSKTFGNEGELRDFLSWCSGIPFIRVNPIQRNG